MAAAGLMARYREAMMCPFCRREEPLSVTAMCGGSFLDADHPSTVRMILVEFDDDGTLLPEHEERLSESRASYRSG